MWWGVALHSAFAIYPANAVVQAINKYGEPLSTAIKDPDLERLRERREWMDALDGIKGAPSAEALSKLQSEARSPFRITRLLLLGGFNAGAVVGLLIIASRLLAALKGGEGAPDVTDTLKNLAINGVAVVVLSLLLARDLQSTNKENRVSQREESLSRLQINLGGDRVLPLAYLRGRIRPVIVAGTSSFVSKAVADAEPYKRALRERGVSIIPVRLKAADPSSSLAALKAEFRDPKEGPAKGFGNAKPSRPPPAPAAAEALSVEADKRWKLEAAVPEEWEAWLAEQKEEAKVKSGNLFLQVQLNGKVRASAEGRPPWDKLAEELPKLDDLRTKISDGLGRR
ncbi:hypothetical protein WJX73_003309 [Symbiochloris irregularis]|uniref:Uncharacterized protein n=1 Tax=Symbiochloris irregularis TaxID=706552 RepID=A0AAW1PML5_9CHLO